MNTIKKFKPGVLHLLSHVRLFSDPVDCSMQSFTISWSLLRLVPIESVMPSERLILYHSLLLLLSIFPSIRVFSSELALCIRWTKYWSFSFSSILPMNVQGWFPLGWTVGAPCSPVDSQESSPAPQSKGINFFSAQPFYLPSSHIHIWLLEKQ